MILSRQDLSDAHNVHECAEEFRRARDFGGPTEILIWAQNWGNALVDNLQNPAVHTDDLEAAEKEATEFEDEAERLKTAISDAVEQMNAAAEIPNSKSRADQYFTISGDLEKALSK